jgi:hypothetical protein
VALTRGPIVTSAIKFKDGSEHVYTIEDSGLPKMFAGLSGIFSNPDLMRRAIGWAAVGGVDNLMKMAGQSIETPLTGYAFQYHFLSRICHIQCCYLEWEQILQMAQSVSKVHGNMMIKIL